jgi:hypothetical protein
MIAFVKGLVPGFLLTWIVCSLVGATGSSGGMLRVFNGEVGHHTLYFSWPLFFSSTGLAWLIFTLLE